MLSRLMSLADVCLAWLPALAREPRFAAPSVSKVKSFEYRKGGRQFWEACGPRSAIQPRTPQGGFNSSPEARKPEPNLKVSEIGLEAPVAAVPSEGYVAKQNRPKGT